jgi:fimbrial chaperone protein
MRLRIALLAIAFACLSIGASAAASLRVAPVELDVAKGGFSTSLMVWNTGKTPVRIQVRVYLWTQKNGEDILTPTKDVVASPPIGTLKPGGENVIRIVRIASTAVTARESYRVLVDQLPDPKGPKAGVVSILIRHAIPLFFEP